MRPFLLYHWSPRARRASILHDGLCPRKLSVDGMWRPPYLCFCRFPTVAWSLSATHSGKSGNWDLWCCWSDHVGLYGTVNTSADPKTLWHRTEYRSVRRIPKSKLWFVGTRRFTPRRRPSPAPDES